MLKRQLVATLLFLLGTAGRAAADPPYWRWSLEQAEKYEASAREKLKQDPNSLESLDKLARAIIVLNGNDLNADERAELIDALKRSYTLAPSQTAAVFLALYVQDPEDSARWAVKAQSFERPSLRALRHFDDLVASNPKFARLENEDMRWARRRQLRWDEILASYGTIRLDMFKSYSQNPKNRRLASSDKTYRVNGKKLEARSKQGHLLWTNALSSEPVKLASFEKCLVTIDSEKLRMLDPATGQVRHTLPSVMKTGLRDVLNLVEWNATESPTMLMGADTERLYVAVSRWFCVFRGKDGSGWAIYFGYTIQAVPCPDEKVLIVRTDDNSIVAYRLSDGKKLWQHLPPAQLEMKLRQVSNTQVVAYVPGLERIVVLDRNTGNVVERLSYETLTP